MESAQKKHLYPLLDINAPLYQDTAPYAFGWLPPAEGHEVYWECCGNPDGNPDGKPALVLHGGPGSGATAYWRQFFDPKKYKVVLFDQRGCGRSKPLAGDTAAALENNTTQHLIADMERLREMLGIESWLLFGGSWGTTLALAYAVTHPQRVSELVLWAVVTTRKSDVDWLTKTMGDVYPEEYDHFLKSIPADKADENPILKLAEKLRSPDPAVHLPASWTWCNWDDRLVSFDNTPPVSQRFLEDRFRLGFARIVTHYFGHCAFLPDDYISGSLHKIAHLPTVLVRGRLDIASPLRAAWEIHKALPQSDLYLIDQAGHGGAEEMHRILAAATAYFAHAGNKA